MAEWLGAGLQNLLRRFESARGFLLNGGFFWHTIVTGLYIYTALIFCVYVKPFQQAPIYQIASSLIGIFAVCQNLPVTLQ